MHSLAALYDGSREIQADIDGRTIDDTDHAAETARTIDAHHPRRLTLTVSEVITETATTSTFRMRREDGGCLPPFLAGQYVTVFVDGTSRPLAISSSPAALDHYDLTVRRVASGRISNHLIDTLRPHDVLTTTGPMGTFHHNPLFHGDDVVFLAGGSGVAPAMSMIRDIVDHGRRRRFHLIHGSRTPQETIFRDELEALAGAHANIRVDHVISDSAPEAREGHGQHRSGLLTAGTIDELAGPLAGRMVYVCGPPAFQPYAMEQLARLNHPRRRTRFEANGPPARPERQPHWPSDTDPTAEVTVSVRGGAAGGAAFRSPRNRPLLDALEDQGIRPEVGCRSGECSLCRIRIVSGEVHTAEEARLRLSDEQFGYTHSCVAYPLTDVEVDF
jgi:glycine betaine catabolism B